MLIPLFHFLVIIILLCPAMLKGQVPYYTFIENKGQWGSGIVFHADIPSGDILIRQQGIRYIFYDQEQLNLFLQHQHGQSNRTQAKEQEYKVDAHMLDIYFEGINQNVQIEASDADKVNINYIKGNDPSKWGTGLHPHKKLIYKELYPHISASFFKNNEGLKYELLVSEGGDVEKIRFRYEGADKLFLNNGDLFIYTTQGKIVESEPYAYQEIRGKIKEVKCKFVLEGNTVSFDVGKYNEDYPLTIDPQLIFSTYSGSTSDHWGNTATYDNNGNFYSGGVVFQTSSAWWGFPGALPVTPGAFQTSFRGGDTDVAIMKFDSTGTNLIYATYIGGNGAEAPTSLITNENQELYILGITSAPNFPVSAGAFDNTYDGGAPRFQWQINGANVGGNQATYNTSTLNDGDSIRALLYSSIGCVSNSPDTSNTIVMKVTSPVTASITITANSSPICSGDSITFSSSVTNGGGAPTIQWFQNGGYTGVNDTVFRTVLSPGGSVYARLFSNTYCVNNSPTLSNTIMVDDTPVDSLRLTLVSDHDSLCSGGTINFIANTKKGGSSPTFDWYLNAINLGVNDSILTLDTLTHQDSLYVVVTSSLGCVYNSVDTSKVLVVDDSASVIPTTNLVSSQVPYCTGATINFTAAHKNAGSPSIQWYLNGAPFGTDTTAIILSGLVENDTIYYDMTPSLTCYDGDSIRSDSIIITNAVTAVPTISISADQNPACRGAVVTFLASITNGGDMPSYQWYINGVPVGADTSILQIDTLMDGDVVTCDLTSSLGCVAGTVTSNIINMTINQTNTSVSISSNFTPVCSGGRYIFTAASVNPGPSPQYNWYVNGVFTALGQTLTISTLNNNDTVHVEMLSSASCPWPNVAVSNEIIVSNIVPAVPTIIITPNSNPICDGDEVVFSSQVTQQGNSPGYNWQVNGSFIGNGPSITIPGLENGDTVTCTLTSSLGCSPPQITDTVIMGVSRSQADIQITSNRDSICQGENVFFSVNTLVNSGSTVTAPLFYRFFGGTDLFVFKLSADGSTMLASTFIGGSGIDGISEGSINDLVMNYGDELRGEIIIDSMGDIYCTSITRSNDFPTVNAFQPNYGGGQYDGCVFKLNSDLNNLIWSSYLGGSKTDAGYSIQLDSTNAPYVAGATTSDDFPASPTALYPSLQGENDGFVARINADGSTLLDATYLGTSVDDQAYFVQIDQDQDVYVLGQTRGQYPISPGVYANPNSGIFIQKMSSDLSASLFSTVVGSGDSTITDIDPNISPTAFLVNECENIFISGWGGTTNDGYPNSLSTVGLPITANAFQTTTDGSDFYFMVLLRGADSLLYATYFGAYTNPPNTPFLDGQEHVDGGTSRFDKKGIIYQCVCAGCGQNQDFPTFPSPGAWSATNNSGNCNAGTIKFDLATLLADFDPVKGCDRLTVDFENLSVGGLGFEWDFGDASTTSTVQPVNVSHTYDTAGTYDIQLIASDITTCIGKDTVTKTITIEMPPVDGASSDSICLGDSTQLQVFIDDTVNYTYSWTPGQSLSDSTVSEPYASPQATTVYTVVIVDTLGCVFIDTAQVVIGDVEPKGAYSKGAGCSDLLPAYNFTHGTKGASDFFWDFGDGSTSFEPSPYHEYADTGQYQVIITVTRGGCSRSDTIPLKVQEIKIPNMVTPNNDGKNELFEITGITGWKVEIYNRWGKRLYLSENYQNEWSPEELADGTYYYLITTDNEEKCKGWILVIR